MFGETYLKMVDEDYNGKARVTSTNNHTIWTAWVLDNRPVSAGTYSYCRLTSRDDLKCTSLLTARRRCSALCNMAGKQCRYSLHLCLCLLC